MASVWSVANEAAKLAIDLTRSVEDLNAWGREHKQLFADMDAGAPDLSASLKEYARARRAALEAR